MPCNSETRTMSIGRMDLNLLKMFDAVYRRSQPRAVPAGA
jgi:hypothetical protein